MYSGLAHWGSNLTNRLSSFSEAVRDRAEQVAQARAVGCPGPAHRAVFVAGDGVGIQFVALAGGLPARR